MAAKFKSWSMDDCVIDSLQIFNQKFSLSNVADGRGEFTAVGKVALLPFVGQNLFDQRKSSSYFWDFGSKSKEESGHSFLEGSFWHFPLTRKFEKLYQKKRTKFLYKLDFKNNRKCHYYYCI
jgi:hypothetical protein